MKLINTLGVCVSVCMILAAMTGCGGGNAVPEEMDVPKQELKPGIEFHAKLAHLYSILKTTDPLQKTCRIESADALTGEQIKMLQDMLGYYGVTVVNADQEAYYTLLVTFHTTTFRRRTTSILELDLKSNSNNQSVWSANSRCSARDTYSPKAFVSSLIATAMTNFYRSVQRNVAKSDVLHFYSQVYSNKGNK